jgi:hypothetical protein
MQVNALPAGLFVDCNIAHILEHFMKNQDFEGVKRFIILTKTTPSWMFWIIIILSSLIILSISQLLSMRIYENKDF